MSQIIAGFSGELDCTPKCHSRVHALQLLTAVTRGTASEIRAYCRYLCHNFSSVTDSLGRNILHLAASCGKWETVEWILQHCHGEVDVRDAESGWTALHRTLFYGQLSAARILLLHGANLRATDHDGLTPLELLINDRLPYIEYIPSNPSEVYVWGSNTNYNLGLGHEQGRSDPELLDLFRRDSVSIKQVVLCKFHSIFLSHDGRVFTCGHGHGGRLGQGSEQTSLTPAPVKGQGTTPCEQVAAGQDHLILLMEGNQVLTCGLNTYHQLGHSPPPDRLLVPRQLQIKFLKGKSVIGVCAARFHSVLYTKDSVFTFGLNAGQLGHPKGDRTQILPRQVAALNYKEWQITHVAASDGATVCFTNKGDVYVLHEYQCRKIASRQVGINKISITGGNLDARCDIAGVREGGGQELNIALLTNSGKIHLWRQSDPFLRRCLFTLCRQLSIGDLHLCSCNGIRTSIYLVTKDGEGFIGNLLPHKEKKNESASPAKPSKMNVAPTSLVTLLERDECSIISVKRIPHIHRATGIVCDSKGRNFAVLQNHPKIGLLDLPSVSSSQIQHHFATLYHEVNADDQIHDVIIQVGKHQYPAHKYILASRSEFFRKYLLTGDNSDCHNSILKVDNIQFEAFEQVLQFIYCNECDLMKEGKEIKWQVNNEDKNHNLNGIHLENDFQNNSYEVCQVKKQIKGLTSAQKKKGTTKNISRDIVGEVKEASRKLGVHALYKKLDNVKIVNGVVKITNAISLPKMKFDRKQLRDFYDICLKSKEGEEFPCHQCVLVGRLEYFNSMLCSSWIETFSRDALPLPIPSKVLDIIIDFLYTDEAPTVYACEDPELLCNVLVAADQLLIDRLREMCEVALVEIITLKNVSELLELSYLYNASQLKATCMQYICINLAAILEARSLDILSEEVMEDLTKTYKSMISAMSKRIITPYMTIPSHEELEFVAEHFPVDRDADIIKSFESTYNKSLEGKGRLKRRTHSQRTLSGSDSKLQKQRYDSVSSDGDILVEVGSPSDVVNENTDIAEELNTSLSEDTTFATVNEPLPMSKASFKKNGWQTTLLKNGSVPSFMDIMKQEEERQKIKVKSISSIECKKNTHVSQKQKKMLASSPVDIRSPSVCTALHQDQSSKQPLHCPWGCQVQAAAHSQSFWNTVAKHEHHKGSGDRCNSENSDSLDQSSVETGSLPPSSPQLTNPWEMTKGQDEIPNLDAIQRAEEEDRRQSLLSIKPKPFHLIHLEDEAIEELLKLYNAEDNPEERITVQRILSDKIARPVWKKQK